MPALALVLLLAQSGWKLYDLEGISLSLPVTPRRVVLKDAPPEVRNWTAGNGEEGVGISLQPVDSRRPAHVVLVGALDSFARSFEGRLTAQADTLLDGWPGIDASVSSPKLGQIRFVAYVTNRGLVTVTAGGTAASATEFGKSVVDSLALKGAFGHGSQERPGPDWKRVVLEPAVLSAEFPVPPARQDNPMSEPGGEDVQFWGVTYGNRRYAVVTRPLEPAELAGFTPEVGWKRIQRSNTLGLLQSRANYVGRKKGTLLGQVSERVEGKDETTGMTFLLESTIWNGRIVVVTVATPSILKDSPEVVRFFASLQAPAK